jgi:hypothetical protein
MCRHRGCGRSGVDPRDPNKPTPLIPSTEWTISDTAAPAAARGSGDQRSPATRLPWLVAAVAVGLASAVAGVVTGVALIGVRPDAPVETGQSAAVAAGTSTPPAAIVEASPVPTWSGARRATWANDGSKTIAFTLASTRDVPAWMSYARPVLAVRCMNRATEVFVVLDTSASFEENDRRTVRVQWDDEPLSVQQWGVSESGRELFAPESAAVVRRMAAARQLRFGFTPFNAQPVIVDFAVEGFDQLAGLVASTCGWRLDERVARR